MSFLSTHILLVLFLFPSSSPSTISPSIHNHNKNNTSMSSTILPAPLADFCGVIAESKRIINAHSRHFLALSVLFLLPLSFSIAAFPTLYNSFILSSSSDHNRVQTLVRLNTSNSFPHHTHQILHRFFHLHFHISGETLAFTLLYITFILLLFISATGSITYSIYHGFYGRPVKLSLALRSLTNSYFRILITLLSSLIFILIILGGSFILFELLAYKLIQVLILRENQQQSQSPLDSPYFLTITSFATLILISSLTKLSANWVLLSPITVLEYRWGIDCLTRSKKLVRRMRWTAIPLIIFFGLSSLILIFVIGSSSTCVGGSGTDFILSGCNGSRKWMFVAQIVVTSAMFTAILLHGLASSTVLYMYCKAVQGELAEEIAKEFARGEYVSLPFDDDKVPHLVSVVAH